MHSESVESCHLYLLRPRRMHSVTQGQLLSTHSDTYLVRHCRRLTVYALGGYPPVAPYTLGGYPHVSLTALSVTYLESVALT